MSTKKDPVVTETIGQRPSHESGSRSSGPHSFDAIEDVAAQHEHRARDSRPPFLRHIVLIAFLLIFLVLFIVNAALYGVSKANNGIGSYSSNHLHYLWTFGPTTVFLLVDAIWYRVDYDARKSMPWYKLSRVSSADQSILLDYISKPVFVTFWQAIKHGHYPVAITNAVSLLIKLMSIVSTGLFVLSLNVLVTRDASLTTTSTFGSTNLVSSPNATAYEVYYASNVLDYPQQSWTVDQYATQSFEPSFQYNKTNSTFSGVLDVFSSTLGECEPARFYYYNYMGHGGQLGASVKLSSNTCPSATWIASWQPINNTNGGLAFPVGCSERDFEEPSPPRLGLFFANITSKLIPVPGFEKYGEKFENFTFSNVAAFVCEPKYAIRKGTVTTREESPGVVNVSSVDESVPGRGLQGLNSSAWLSTVWSSIAVPGDFSVIGNAGLEWPTSPPTIGDAFINLMVRQTRNPVMNSTSLLDPQRFLEIASSVWSGLGAHVASQYLMNGSNGRTAGAVAFEEDRLIVNAVSFGLIGAVLVVTMALTLALIFIVPSNVVYRSQSIGGVATALATSSTMTKIFEDRSIWFTEAITDRSRQYSYIGGVESNTKSGEGYAIRALPLEVRKTQGKAKEKKAKWWHSPAASLITAATLIVLLCSLIVALEVMYHESATSHGLGNVDPDGSDHYAWQYVPALLTVLATAFFQALDSTARIMEPFSLLRRGNGSGFDTILVDYLDRFALAVLPKAIRRGRFAIFASTLAIIFGPVLTIAVSGLFYPEAMPYQGAVSIQQIDTFNLTGLDRLARTNPVNNVSIINDWPIHGATDAVVAASLLLQTAFIAVDGPSNKEAVSDSTWGPTAIPHFRPQTDDALFHSATSLNTTMSILVPTLECSPPVDYFSAMASPSGENYTIGSGNVTLDMDPNCPLYSGGPRGFTGTTTKGKEGVFFDISWDYGDNDLYRGYFGETYWQLPSHAGVIDSSCPFVVILYGQFMDNGTLVNDASRFITCSAPELGSQLGNFTFNVPDLTINATNNPAPINDTFKPKTPITLVLDRFLPPTSYPPFDNVVSLMLTMTQNSTINLSSGNTLVEVFQTLYTTSIAQFMNYVQRIPMAENLSVDHLEPPSNFTGTYENPYRARLLQSEVSTRILQAVFGIMLLCAIVTYATLERGDFIPVNPCSIAAKASLLSGARFLHDGTIPPGAEWMTDEELKRAGVFSRESFSIGWWDTQRKKRKRASEVSMRRDEDGAARNLLERGGLRYGIDADD
ncbi:MAG: hypothetical protein M1828_006647 [Chrysothrix sp. TS-e1954]|nr:MAG: hypothetical protein M1828_006647 [Chrysothrix sp. TS-e1954]